MSILTRDEERQLKMLMEKKAQMEKPIRLSKAEVGRIEAELSTYSCPVVLTFKNRSLRIFKLNSFEKLKKQASDPQHWEERSVKLLSEI